MLSDKIWITRKARIYCERRLRFRSQLSQILIIYYSLLLVLCSLWNLTYSSTQIVNLILIFGSLAVLVFSVYIYSQKYEERSIAMRNCYINLDKIYLDIKRAEENNDIDKIKQFHSEYSSVLSNIENHSDYDYLCLRYSLRAQQTTLQPFTGWDYVHYLLEICFRWIIIFLFFLIPFIMVLIWFVAQKYVSI